MTATLGGSLIATGVALMVAGLVMIWASLPRPARQHARAHRAGAGLSGELVCTSFGGGVIEAVEWLILSQTRPGTAWLAALAVPAFLAAATVTRVIVIARTVHVRRRVGAIRAERGCHR